MVLLCFSLCAGVDIGTATGIGIGAGMGMGTDMGTDMGTGEALAFEGVGGRGRSFVIVGKGPEPGGGWEGGRC